MSSQAKRYALWVLEPANERETGRLIKLAAQRFLRDLERKDIRFDEVEAVKMVDFCEEHLCQWEGDWEGLPLKFEPWQRFIFEQVYGWIRVDSGTRRFEEVFVEISKKNGKSTMCAGLMNYHVFADDKVKTPKVFTAANNEDQAKICVNMAGRIVEFSPALAEMVEDGLVGLMTYKENITEVINYENNGFIKAFSKESGDKTSKTAGGKHGVNASLGVVDEFGMAPDHGASKPIRSSMASRLERLMFYITTAGFNMEGPCYKEQRKIGIDVLEGTVVKDSYLPIIFEIDHPVIDGKPQEITIDWLLENEWAWKHSNPNIDVSVRRDFLRAELEDAKIKGGTTEVDTKTLNFNIWVNSPSTFISAEVWAKNAHGSDEPDGMCYAGLEVGSSGQVTALALLFPGDPVKIKMVFIASEETVNNSVNLTDLKDCIRIDPGNEVDVDVAVEWIAEEFSKYELHSFCYPNTMKNNSIVQRLIKLGYEGAPLSQGVLGVSNPTEEWEKMIRAGEIEHYNNKLLGWMNSNCLAIKKEQGTRIEKNGKVLGIYACINAVAQWKTIGSESTDIGILYL